MLRKRVIFVVWVKYDNSYGEKKTSLIGARAVGFIEKSSATPSSAVL